MSVQYDQTTGVSYEVPPRVRELIEDPERLAAVRRTGLLDTSPEEVFDRFVRLASRVLGTPVAIFSLLDRDRHFFKSAVGLPEPWATRRERPLHLSFCHDVLARGGPLVIEDASAHPSYRQHPAVVEFGIGGYIGVPVCTPDGHGIGSMCVMDLRPRGWTPDQIASLEDLAAAVMGEIELRGALHETAAARQHAELAQARYRHLLEDIDAIVWEADATTWQFTFVSPHAERILGYPVEQWLSRPGFWVDTLHADDREAAVRFCTTATAEGRDHEFEYRAVARDGRVVWLRDIVRVISGPDGRPRLRGIMVDVTAQKEIERELRYQRSLLECQSEASVLGILVVSAEGRMVSFNRRFVDMWRLPPEVMQTRSDEAALRAVADQLVRPQEYFERVAYLYEHPDEVSREDIHLRDGRVFDRYSAPVHANGVNYGRVWFFHDVTSERQAERRKDEFIAMLGHELRNPLAPILSAVQLLRLPGAPPDMCGRAQDVIERQVTRMTRLIDDLLDLSRITRGRIGLQRCRIELSRVLERAIETAQPTIGARQHRLAVTRPPEPVWLDADEARLEQVFSNLLNNAAKYTDPGGRIEVTAERAGADVLVRVRDDGIGITPEALPRVFELFVQLPGSRERSQGGLGIGLTLVRAIVELHGGGVEVTSAGPGRGSEFVVRLPCSAAPGATAEEAPAACPAGGRLLEVLIVDDNADAAGMLAEYLASCGHSVRVAHDGARALELARAAPPDVALLDIELPGMSGYDLAEHLRETLHPRPPVFVALTGYGQAADCLRSKEAGFAHHLVKPVDPETIDRLLQDG